MDSSFSVGQHSLPRHESTLSKILCIGNEEEMEKDEKDEEKAECDLDDGNEEIDDDDIDDDVGDVDDDGDSSEHEKDGLLFFFLLNKSLTLHSKSFREQTSRLPILRIQNKVEVHPQHSSSHSFR